MVFEIRKFMGTKRCVDVTPFESVRILRVFPARQIPKASVYVIESTKSIGTMSFILFKRASVQIVTTMIVILIMVVVVLCSYVPISNRSAHTKANNACNSIDLRQSRVFAALTLSQVSADFPLRIFDSDTMRVGFKGAFVEKWFCNVTVANDRVVSKVVRHFD